MLGALALTAGGVVQNFDGFSTQWYGEFFGDAQLLARYQAWRSLDTLMVAFATDSLTRLYGIPGQAASAVRRLGMAAVQRIGPLRDRLTAEARGESGDLPLLLRGLPI